MAARTSRRLFRIHRAFGLSLALVALVLAVTGLLLNHTDDLHLAERKLQSAWLLDLYGIEAPRAGDAYPAGGRWISQWDGQLFLDAAPLSGASRESREPLLGAFRLDAREQGSAALAVVTATRLLLLTDGGDLIDSLAYPGDRKAARAAVNGAGAVIVETKDGARWATTPDFLGFAEAAPAAGTPPWVASQPLPDDLRARIGRHWRGDGVSVERLVLDLHNGRLVGRAGTWLMDAAGVALIVLVATGLLSVWRSRRRRGSAAGR